MLHVWRFVTVLLAALGLTLGAAHTLELPPKMQYDGELYAAVTSTLYRLYGTVGAAVQVAAVAAAAVLVFLVRGRRSFRLTMAGAAALAGSLVVWGMLVAPVNAEWARVIESSPSSVPAAYLRLRSRWEYGHLAAFAVWLAGFCLLLASLLADPSSTADREPV